MPAQSDIFQTRVLIY